jgi:hypothetical protein
MTSEMGEMFNALKKERQEKRVSNRESSAEYLRERGVPFEEKNFGAHLIVEGRECLIDFWPGTGKWNSRCGKKGFGVRNLVAFIGAPSNQEPKEKANGK